MIISWVIKLSGGFKNIIGFILDNDLAPIVSQFNDYFRSCRQGLEGSVLYRCDIMFICVSVGSEVRKRLCVTVDRLADRGGDGVYGRFPGGRCGER